MAQLEKLQASLREFVRAVRADLVEKRLWPVAALLIAAVVAIPVVATMNSSGSGSTPAPSAPAPGVGVAAGGPAATSTQHTGHLGPLHDPFAGKTGSGSPSAGTSAAAPNTAVRVTPNTSATTGGSTNAAPGGGQTVKPAPATPVPTSPRPTTNLAAKSLRVYHVSFHFGQGTDVRAFRDVTRLEALPSVTTPVVQLLGVMQSGAKAAFLVWNASSASGDGVCRSGKTPCDIVELKPGSSEFVDVVVPGSGTVQFELDLDSIKVTHATTELNALDSHAKQSQAGASLILKSKATALSELKYSTVLGTIVASGNKAASASFHPHAYISSLGLHKRHT